MKIKTFILSLLLFSCYAQAYEIPLKTIDSHTFKLSLKPTDEESRDAMAADLYITRFPESGWIYEGSCDKIPNDSDKKFTRVVTVDSDGDYYFISKGGDAAGMAKPPHKNDFPQVKVTVDTTPPKVRFVAPVHGTILKSGETIRIDWVAEDKNMALTPIDIYYTDGKSGEWQKLAENQPNTGHYQWQVPLAQYNGLKFKVSARDIAGNTAEAVSEDAYRVMLPDKIAEIHKVSLPVEVELNPVQPSLLDRQIKVETLTAATETAAETDGYIKKDPRPKTEHPELDANDANIPRAEKDVGRAAYIAYIMGSNLVRQGRLKDSLRYYRTAVDADPNFHQAWNDMALVYKQLGAFAKADSCIVKSLALVPNSPRYLNTRGAIYQGAGFEILQDPASAEESLARANDLILFAVKSYGDAVAAAQKQGKLAECAETYFHLGEICYFANQDATGARQYWIKVLDLHSPTPDLDNIILDHDTPQEQLSRSIYEKNTELWVNLKSWQMWAREYIEQLNNLERGLVQPRAPISTGQFQQYANPALGASALQPQAAGSGAYGLNPSGKYYSTTPPVVYQGSPYTNPNAKEYQGVTYNQGVPMSQVPQGKYIIPDNGTSIYVPLQANTIPPQGAWSRADYGSTPDYTYKQQ